MEDFQSMKHLKLEALPMDCKFFKLEEIFLRQNNLYKSYGWHKAKTREEITQVNAQAIASEAQELMNNCNWKPWKKTKKKFEKIEAIYEYIDILHFVINGLIALDVNAEECMQYYLAKNKENHARIERGY